MLTILGALCSPLDGDDHLDLMRMRDAHRLQETLTGPCDDDCEVTAPFIGVCPDESAHPEGSPLDFGGVTAREFAQFDAGMDAFLRLGFDYSMHASICAQAHANGRDPYATAP